MAVLSGNLNLERCPHCSVANPCLKLQHHFETQDHTGNNKRHWGIYCCGNCGGVVTAYAPRLAVSITDYFPVSAEVPKDIPERAKSYLAQAIASIHAPAGAVMLAASAVDAMLKEKKYTKGSLYSRIQTAIDDNILTTEMGTWAHEVRLDANDQRHADEAATLPTSEDAKKVIEFASAIAEYLFVLPARVRKGLGNKE